jgi:hypothetical protein
MIVTIGVSLFMPLFFSWLFSPFGQDIASPSKPAWLGMGLAVATFLVVLFTVMPFIVEHLFLGAAAPQLRARGKDPRVVVLHNAVASSGFPSFIGFVMAIVGAPTYVVYVSSIVAVTSVLFWVWRYGDLVGLRSTG